MWDHGSLHESVSHKLNSKGKHVTQPSLPREYIDSVTTSFTTWGGGTPGNSWQKCVARFFKSWPDLGPKNVIYYPYPFLD